MSLVTDLKVAIVGSAPHKVDAPFDDKAWSIWACAPANIDLPRWDEWFEIHTYADCVTRYPGYLQFLQAAGGRPVWVAMDHKDIPAAIGFDSRKLFREFGMEFFGEGTGGSTVAYMMAEAIYRGANEIALYGIDMATSSEYWTQRAGCMHFATIAKLRGIKVTIHPSSALLRSPSPYGVHTPSYVEANIRERIGIMEASRKAMLLEYQRLEGKIAVTAGGIGALKETLRLNYGVQE